VSRYTVISNLQLFVLAILVGLFSASAVVLNSMYHSYKLLPQVIIDGNGQCVKVVNFENGHAFTCQDVDVVLRQYRKRLENEALHKDEVLGLQPSEGPASGSGTLRP
jgi:hypothetical protein